MKKAFTLTEVLVAAAIVGVLAAIVLPHLIISMQNGLMDEGFKRNELSIKTALDILPSVENTTFNKTSMYLSETPDNYENSSGMFMKKYLKLARVCDQQHDCFADNYYQYDEENHKSNFNLPFVGYCAILKSGAALCLKPQIDEQPVWGIMDINGPKGPNVLGRDLRTLNFDVQAAAVNSNETSVTTAPVGITPGSSADLCTSQGGVYYTYQGTGYCFPGGGQVSYEQAVQTCLDAGQHLETDPDLICQIVANKVNDAGEAPNYSCLTYWTGSNSGVCCEINRNVSPRNMTGSWHNDKRNPNGKMCSP